MTALVLCGGGSKGAVEVAHQILRRAGSIAIDRKYHADIQRYAGQARLGRADDAAITC
jgi:hypothetical protein